MGALLYLLGKWIKIIKSELSLSWNKKRGREKVRGKKEGGEKEEGRKGEGRREREGGIWGQLSNQY